MEQEGSDGGGVRSCARFGEVVGKDSMNVGGGMQVSFVSTSSFPLFAVMWKGKRKNCANVFEGKWKAVCGWVRRGKLYTVSAAV
jgi:hypothetical protein